MIKVPLEDKEFGDGYASFGKHPTYSLTAKLTKRDEMQQEKQDGKDEGGFVFKVENFVVCDNGNCVKWFQEPFQTKRPNVSEIADNLKKLKTIFRTDGKRIKDMECT